jgi:hypothetical protein
MKLEKGDVHSMLAFPGIGIALDLGWLGISCAEPGTNDSLFPSNIKLQMYQQAKYEGGGKTYQKTCTSSAHPHRRRLHSGQLHLLLVIKMSGAEWKQACLSAQNVDQPIRFAHKNT